MKKIIEYVKKHWVIFAVVIIIIIPLGINIGFKIPAFSKWFSYEEKAGDIINFYASILATAGTVFLGYIAFKQNEFANELNKRLVKLEETTKGVYVLLNENNSFFDYDNKNLTLSFYNDLSDIPIIDDKLKSLNTPIEVVEIKNGVPAIEIVTLSGEHGFELNRNELIIYCSCRPEQTEEFIFCFELELTSIYGYKTTQLFDLWIYRGKIHRTKTIVKES